MNEPKFNNLSFNRAKEIMFMEPNLDNAQRIIEGVYDINSNQTINLANARRLVNHAKTIVSGYYENSLKKFIKEIGKSIASIRQLIKKYEYHERHVFDSNIVELLSQQIKEVQRRHQDSSDCLKYIISKHKYEKFLNGIYDMLINYEHIYEQIEEERKDLK